jgi:hypothetical protein
MSEFLELVEEINPTALSADGFEGCELGVAYRAATAPVIAYDREKCIRRLMERDGMTWEDAEEFFEFNVVAAWVGDGTPIFVDVHHEGS